MHLCLLLKRSFFLFAHSEPNKPLKLCFIQPAANMLNIDHVLKHFPELQVMIFPINCLVFLNMTPGTLLTWALRHRALPDFHSLMLQRALALPARQSECWYYQQQSCFLPYVKAEQGNIYVLHRVHECCTAHHTAENPQPDLNKSTKGHFPQQ